MRVASILDNDIADSENGICVSLWVSGCPHQCKGCHNSELWDFNYGEDLSEDYIVEYVSKLIVKNNLQRNFSVLGGEPFCRQNIESVQKVISRIRSRFPSIKIYVWTGYVLENLKETSKEDIFWKQALSKILEDVDVIVDGPFIETLRDIRLPLRGSSNQRILRKESKDF